LKIDGQTDGHNCLCNTVRCITYSRTVKINELTKLKQKKTLSRKSENYSESRDVSLMIGVVTGFEMCCSPMFNHTHITLCSCIENMMYQRHMAVTWRVFVTEASDAELERVLLLVLGCAVQSDEREQFIENIRRLDVDVQRAIVDAIQQVCSVLHCNMHFLHVRFITNFPIVERLHKLLVLVLNDYRQTPYI